MLPPAPQAQSKGFKTQNIKQLNLLSTEPLLIGDSSRLSTYLSRFLPASPQIVSANSSPARKVACACRETHKKGACELDHCGNQIRVRRRVFKRRPGACSYDMARRFR